MNKRRGIQSYSVEINNRINGYLRQNLDASKLHEIVAKERYFDPARKNQRKNNLTAAGATSGPANGSPNEYAARAHKS